MAIPVFILITDLDLGGAPLVVRALAAGLHARGEFAPTVISLAPPGPVSHMLAAAGVPVLSLQARSALQLPMVMKRWLALLRQHQPRLVLSVLIHANIIAALGRRWGPPAAYLQSIHTLQRHPVWHWSVQGKIARNCAALVAPSAAILQNITHYGPFNVGLVVPNGIDIDRFHLAPPPGISLPWPPSARIVGYLGRFDPVKRLPLLLDAAAHAIAHNLPIAKDLHLALVGWGQQEQSLRQQAAHLGLTDRIHFLGPTTAPENWYKSFDILCLPSDAEGFGLTVIEALAAGRRVLAADIPPLRAIQHPGLHLISDLSPASLALSLQQVINEPPLPPEVADKALAELRRQFSVEAMVEGYSKIFRQFSRP